LVKPQPMQQIVLVWLAVIAVKVGGVLVANESRPSQKTAKAIAAPTKHAVHSSKTAKVQHDAAKPVRTALAAARLRTQKLNASYGIASKLHFNHNKTNQTVTHNGTVASSVNQTLVANESRHSALVKREAASKPAANQAVHMMSSKRNNIGAAKNDTYTAMPGSAVAAGPCACEFRGTCSCQATMDFMDCIADACASGKCDCNEQQYQHACYTMADECPSLDMQCSKERAVCLFERDGEFTPVKRVEKAKASEDIYEELKDLKERKCRLQMASEDGWLNADKQLTEVNTKIDKAMSVLETRSEKTPEMHCEKHFEEWTYPESSRPRSGTLTPGSGWIWALALISLVVARA